MVLRARRVSDSPESYFQQNSDEGPFLRVADIMLRYHRTYTHPFTDFIRLGTHSKLSIVVRHADTPPALLAHADLLVQGVEDMTALLRKMVERL